MILSLVNFHNRGLILGPVLLSGIPVSVLWTSADSVLSSTEIKNGKFFPKSHQTDRVAAKSKHLAPISSNVFNYCVGNEHEFFQSPLLAILFTLEKPILFIYFLPRQSMASSASSYGSIRERLLQKLNQGTCAQFDVFFWPFLQLQTRFTFTHMPAVKGHPLRSLEAGHDHRNHH